MIYILLGAPGSGKGTISDRLVRNHDFKHISTGNIFRGLAKSNSEIANKVKALMNSGHLIDDKTTGELLLEELKKYDYKTDNIILDGYPRNKEQLLFLLDFFKKNDLKDSNYFFYLDISDKKVIERLSNRLYCPKCERTYHKIALKPVKKGICDDDGTKLLRREDDNPENIKVRLETYHKQTMPMIDSLKGKNFKILDADKNADFILKEIINV